MKDITFHDMQLEINRLERKIKRQTLTLERSQRLLAELKAWQKELPR